MFLCRSIVRVEYACKSIGHKMIMGQTEKKTLLSKGRLKGNVTWSAPEGSFLINEMNIESPQARSKSGLLMGRCISSTWSTFFLYNSCSSHISPQPPCAELWVYELNGHIIAMTRQHLILQLSMPCRSQRSTQAGREVDKTVWFMRSDRRSLGRATGISVSSVRHDMKHRRSL